MNANSSSLADVVENVGLVIVLLLLLRSVKTVLSIASILGATVRVAVFDAPAYVAAIVTVLLEETATVVTVKFAVLAPAATVTFAGTVATAVLLLDSDTAMPPVGAIPVNCTVPVEELPPATDVGFSANADNAGGFTVRVAVLVSPL